MSESTKNQFFSKLTAIHSLKKSNSQSFSSDKIRSIIDILTDFEKLENKEKIHYYYRKHYEVFVCASEKILRKKGTSKRIVSLEDLFEVLSSAHSATGHGGRDAMVNHLANNFANVTREEIVVFTSFCEQFQRKKGRIKKSIVVKPILSNELNSRCQVDLIDLQSQPSGPFKFILNYQDHLTKFIRLRPMKTKTAEETAENILEIFCELGAPHILQSDNGREFDNEVVTSLVKRWPDCKIVHGKPRHSQSQGSIERANRDVQDKLACWLASNNTSDWVKGLKFVQFQKNASFHKGIGRTPYEAMYGCPPKMGIRSTLANLPTSIINNINSEDDLEKVLNAILDDNEGLDKESDAQSEDSENMDIVHTDANDTIETQCISCLESVSALSTCKSCNQPVHHRETCSKVQSHSSQCAPEYECLLCHSKNLIISTRSQAKRKLRTQANKMMENSRSRLQPCAVGDNVMVPIPDVDRAKTDFRNITAVILNVNDGFYTLGTEHGKINSSYTRNQFAACAESFISINDVPDKNMTLRSTATAFSVGTGQGFFKCNCKSKCHTDKCKCKKNNVLCNSKCHKSLPCSNK